MNAATHKPTLILALDRQPQQWALETAFTLAQQLHGRLEGLFVEDLNLLRLAQLPFSQEIAALTAACHPLVSSTMEQALRSQANRLQRLLAAQAELQQIEWRFSVVRDHLLRAVLNATPQADLFIMQGTLLPARNAGNVAALYDGSMESIDTAAYLAHSGSLHILLGSHHDSERSAITRHLRSLALQPLFVTLADDRVVTLRAVVQRHRIATLVIPEVVLNQNQRLLQPLIEELACTIVVMPSANVI